MIIMIQVDCGIEFNLLKKYVNHQQYFDRKCIIDQLYEIYC